VIYRGIVGSLGNLVNMTLPDLVFDVLSTIIFFHKLAFFFIDASRDFRTSWTSRSILNIDLHTGRFCFTTVGRKFTEGSPPVTTGLDLDRRVPDICVEEEDKEGGYRQVVPRQ
jgi:hypothetical protein